MQSRRPQSAKANKNMWVMLRRDDSCQWLVASFIYRLLEVADAQSRRLIAISFCFNSLTLVSPN
jgi:hypothetical protein